MQFELVSANQPNLPLAPRLLAEYCADFGARLFLDPQFRYFGYIQTQSGARLPIKGGALPLNSYAAGEAARDKDFCGRLLQDAGLLTPEFKLIHSPHAILQLQLASPHVAAVLHGHEQADKLAEELGYPLYIKPNEGTQGLGVQKVTNATQLTEALERALQTNDRMLLQRAVTGRDYRLIILDGKVLAITERRPFSITGDGTKPIQSLLAEKASRLKTRGGGHKISADDLRITKMLESQGLALTSIPEAGQELQLLPNANLSTGGQAVDVTQTAAIEHQQLAVQAAQACGLRYAGVDLLCEDISNRNAPAHVLELNAGPGLTNFWQASQAHEAVVRHIYKSVAAAMLSA